jgi:hypothetical protein
MKQYYRFLLLQEEVSASSREAMSQQIRSWKQYGQLIDSTKQKLFSFDEVIQLTAVDTTIPELKDTGLDENIEGLNDREPVDASDLQNNIDVDSDGMNEAADKMEDAADKNNEAADKMEDAADKNDGAANKADEAANKNDGAANKADGAANKNEDAANKSDEAANKNEDAANKNTEAANTNNNAATGMGSASAGMNTAATTLKTSLDGVDNSFSNGANKLKDAIESGLNNGSQSLESAMTNAGASITTQLSATNQLGIRAVQETATALMNALYNVGANINGSFQSTASKINANLNNVGNTWVSKLNSVGNAIMGKLSGIYNNATVQAFQSKIGSRLGAKSNISFSNTSSNSSIPKNKLDVLNQIGARINNTSSAASKASSGSRVGSHSISSSVVSAAKNKVTGTLKDPFELGDLVSSLRNTETGQYEWYRLPSASLGMAYNSLTSPVRTFAAGAQATDSNNYLDKAIGGYLSYKSFEQVENIGDILNTAEVLVDFFNHASGEMVDSSKLHEFANNWDSNLSKFYTKEGLSSYKEKEHKAEDWDPSVYQIPGHNYTKFASGGIGTKESLISAFEGDKAEAVIPLESQQGVDYLANALQQAGAGDGGGSSSVVVNVNLSGLNLADNDAQWERVGRKISEVIEIQTQRRGKLSYGSK